MTWERRKREHECKLPDVWQTHRKPVRAGDIWKCRRCGARWELTYKGIPSRDRVGPGHENAWVKLGSPEDIWRDVPPKPQAANPAPLIPDPPRQTGTDWLYSVDERR